MNKVLDYCNSVRFALGLPPVKEMQKGERGKLTTCPISMTINNGDFDFVFTDENSIMVANGYKQYYFITNRHIREFIIGFDSGEHSVYLKTEN